MAKHHSKTFDIHIKKEAFNDVYLPLLHCQKRYIVLCGGAGSGKSVFTVQRYLYRLLTEPGRNLLVVRAVQATHRNSTFALFRQMIGKWNLTPLFEIAEGLERIRCKNGNEIIFKGLDNSEKLKSVTFSSGELTDIWVEEASEIEEHDFNQLAIRLRGGTVSKQIVLSFNPVSVHHWLKRRFFDHPPKDAVTLRTTYKDNRFLSPEDGAVLESFRETDPYYYQVYCLGEWGVLGKSIFDAQAVNRRLNEIRSLSVRCGSFVCCEQDGTLHEIQFIDEPDGAIRIYSPPEPGVQYVIGGDTAGDGSDAFVGQVIESRTGRQVATLHRSFDEDVYAKQMFCLGTYYNNALIACEVNFSTYPVRELQRLHYPRQYYREIYDSITRDMEYRYGFLTNRITRPVILAELIRIVREQPELFCDERTLNEMLTFVRSKDGRAEAASGAHDDCVMALAIAFAARHQAAGAIDEE